MEVAFEDQLAGFIDIVMGSRLLDGRHGDLLVFEGGWGLTHFGSAECSLSF